MDFLKDFGVSPILLAAQVVNFLILLFILKKFLYKPILEILEKRKELIVKTLKNAEESEKIYQEASEKADRIIARASEESKRALDETKNMGTQILEDYHKLGAEILQRANQEALKFTKVEKEKLMQEIREDASNLAIVMFEKVIGKKLSKEDQKIIFDKELKNI